MACSLQKLFSVEADFEDEDFLLAVRDVEKQASDLPPASFRGLRPLSTGAPSSTITLAKDSGTTLSSVATSPVVSVEDQPGFGHSSCPRQIKCNQISPLVNSLKIQKDHTTLTPGCKSTANSGRRFKFVKRQATVLPSGDAACDEEIDNELVLAACMDLEESGLQSCPRSFRSDCETREQLRNSSVATAKKPRVANPLVLTNSFGSENTPLEKAQEETFTEVVSHLLPVETSSKLTSQSATTASCMSWPIPGVSGNTDTLLNSSRQMLKSLQMPPGKSIAECNSLGFGLDRSTSSFLSASTPPRPSKPWMSNQSFSGPAKVSSGAQLLTAYGSSGVPVMTSPATTKASLSTATAGNLQTPVVTNHLVRLVTAANKTPQPVSHISLRTKVRRFPGPAGLLPHQPDGRNLEEILVTTPQTPTHGALAKLQTEELSASQQPTELEFERGPWVAMKTEMGLDERDPSCFLRTYSVIMVLRKAALKQLPKNKVPSMAVMIKSLTRTNVDAGAVLKDPTGEIQGTIHRLLLEEKESEFKAGSVLLLKQVGVFSPSHRNHYLNVTPSNLVKIYPPGYNIGKSLQSYQEIRERMEMVPPQVVSEFQSNPPSDILAAMARTGYHSGESCEKDRNYSQHTSDKGSSLTPAPSISRTGKTVSNVPSPEAEKVDSDDLDQLLGELPDDFFSNLDAQNSS
ncbi:homologous recombination OB-fold protein [Pogona vitticeps]